MPPYPELSPSSISKSKNLQQNIVVDKIYDVHLKDTEILWPILCAGGIDPPATDEEFVIRMGSHALVSS